MNIFADVHLFQEKMDHNTVYQTDYTRSIAQRKTFLKEEVEELISALDSNDLPEIIDGALDTIYVAAGVLCAMGLPSAVCEEFWNEVQRSNMDKVPSSPSMTTKRGFASGDAVKPRGWKGPKICTLIRKHVQHFTGFSRYLAENLDPKRKDKEQW